MRQSQTWAGPHLWSQGSGSQAYVLATDLSKAYCGSTRNCEDGKNLGHQEALAVPNGLSRRFARPVVTYGISNEDRKDADLTRYTRQWAPFWMTPTTTSMDDQLRQDQEQLRTKPAAEPYR